MIIIGLTIIYTLMQLVSVVFLFYRQRREKEIAKALSGEHKNNIALPAISVVTSLKGLSSDLEEGIRCIMKQKYNGAIEFVLVVQDKDDPAIKVVKNILEKIDSNVEVRWIYDFIPMGANPRSAKMAEGIKNTKYDWIYWHAVDSIIGDNYFTESMYLINEDKLKYATTFPVNINPKSFGAKIETMALNLEVTKYFAFSFLDRNAAVAYGGSLLANKCLLKHGALELTLNRLTDDVILAQNFKKLGGKCVMGSQLTYVNQEYLSFKGFLKRQLRWNMIARYYMKPLFFISPLFWLPQHFLILGLIIESPKILFFSAVCFLIRILQISIFEYLLNAPKKDMLHSWLIPIYDLLLPFCWLFAIFIKKVNWSGDIMIVGKSGILQTTLQKQS